MYCLLRPLLFCFPPELAHDISLALMKIAKTLGLLRLFAVKVPDVPVEVMGLQFPNPVGLAAGLDKNGDFYSALGSLGFGFIEIGTVTPLAQPGNPKPRMFRLTKEKAIINRMGFNNKGVKHLVKQVQARGFNGILGINIGKNKNTSEADALSDYQTCMDEVFPYADYIAINISSPNTPGLRDLQHGEKLRALLSGIKERQHLLAQEHQRQVPIAVKVAPDMTDEQLQEMAEIFIETKIDAVIATNTTVSRSAVAQAKCGREQGGLSGSPLTEPSTQAITKLSQCLKGVIPIIGVGGIMNGRQAAEKIHAGASLVQLYSGFVFRGPDLIAEAAKAAASALVLPAAEKTERGVSS